MLRSCVVVLILGLPVQSEDTWKVVRAKPSPPVELPKAIAQLLDSESLTVHRGKDTVAEFWFRSELPSSADADQVKNGLTYREIPETTLLGVVKFSAVFTDYRKQEIPVGLYTMRLAVQPDVGDHKDTAPHADFVLLVPIAKESNADTMDAKDLLKLSRAATGGEHPGVMLLYPGKAVKKEPTITDRGQGVKTLDLIRNVVANGKTAPMGFSITVSGWSQSRE